jgi:hypothetical protein
VKVPDKHGPLTREALKAVLDYDPLTGLFIWKPRPIRTGLGGGVDQAWNSRCAGKEAGALHSKGYVTIHLGGRAYLAHRLAWFYVTGEWPAEQIDHKNTQRHDNRFENLRPATPRQNQGNRNGTRPVKGITFRKGAWLATCAGVHLGSFRTQSEARAAYAKAATAHFGEFARA